MLFELIKGLIMDLDGTAVDEVCLRVLLFLAFFFNLNYLLKNVI